MNYVEKLEIERIAVVRQKLENSIHNLIDFELNFVTNFSFCICQTIDKFNKQSKKKQGRRLAKSGRPWKNNETIQFCFSASTQSTNKSKRYTRTHKNSMGVKHFSRSFFISLPLSLSRHSTRFIIINFYLIHSPNRMDLNRMGLNSLAISFNSLCSISHFVNAHSGFVFQFYIISVFRSSSSVEHIYSLFHCCVPFVILWKCVNAECSPLFIRGAQELCSRCFLIWTRN